MLAPVVFCDEPFQGIPETDKLVFYCADQRHFAWENRLNAITARLDEIRSLQINVLWIKPITAQGRVKNPYVTVDHKKIEPADGTMDDLRRLVGEAHKRGIAVILDLVANHTAWDHPWVSERPDFYHRDENGNVTGPPYWPETAKLNYDNPETRKAMIDIMNFWIVEANIDGYRCDAGDHVPASFWKEAIGELRAMQPGRKIIMLNEGWKPENLASGHDLDCAWFFAEDMEFLFEGNTRHPRTVQSLYERHRKEFSNDVTPDGKQKLRYVTTHDLFREGTLRKYGSQEAVIAGFVIALTMGGVPLIFGSQEIGFGEGLYIPKNWNLNPEIFDTYKKLMEIRVNSPALNGKWKVQTFANPDIVSFMRVAETEVKVATASSRSQRQDAVATLEMTEEIFVAVNVRREAKKLEIPADMAGTKWTNLMDYKEMILSSNMEMPPHGYLILRRK